MAANLLTRLERFREESHFLVFGLQLWNIDSNVTCTVYSRIIWLDNKLLFKDSVAVFDGSWWVFCQWGSKREPFNFHARVDKFFTLGPTKVKYLGGVVSVSGV